jgi:hypothetical protein
MLLCGVFLVLYTTQLEGWRFPKAEAAGYLLSAIGLIATCITAIGALRYVPPVPGCVVQFWGPDGKTKVTGRIRSVDRDTFSVDTELGQLSLRESSFLRVERPTR